MEKAAFKKKLINFLDEILVFIVILFSVLFSDGILKALHGKPIGPKDFQINFWSTIAAAIIAIGVYAKFNSNFKTEDIKNKPHIIKRCYNALCQGALWKTVLDFSDN